MATKPKRKMKYPPGCARTDTMELVQENLSPINCADHARWLRELRLRNHSAVTEFVRGRGSKGSMECILQMHNMTRGMVLMGFGVDLTSIILDSEKVLQAIAARVRKTGSFTLYANEIAAINALLELHEAQLDVATVGDVDRAYQKIKDEFRGGKRNKLSLTREEATT